MPEPSASLPHRRWVPFVLLAGMWVLLALVTIPTWGWTYWDFGDGNYMYIARRVREGLVLYKDILAPQPPLHTLGGVIAEWLGGALIGSELYGVRVYCLLLRMLGSLAVMLLAWRYFNCTFRAVSAAAIYLTLPIGFWWTLCYQSENLEIIFLVFSLFFLIQWDRQGAFAGGVLGALACHCNMTGVPYVMVNALFLALRFPRLLQWYAGSALGVYTVIALGANWWTEGAFIGNVLLNQVGTFPRTDILGAINPGDTFWGYAIGKISREGFKVLEIEGGFILAALVGMASMLIAAPADSAGERPRWLRTEFMVWSAIGLMLSICFTAKGGTVNYIFVIGEPAVALFAAEAFVLLWRMCAPRADHWRTLSVWNTMALLRLLVPIIATVIVYLPAKTNLEFTFSEVQAELPERKALELRGFIESYAEPGDTILAPPFYAFLTKTNVAGELAENYIWQIKHLNETFDRDSYGKPTGEAVAKMEEIAGLLRARAVKVVLLDTAQTGRIGVIRDALEAQYQLAEPKRFQTRNTVLELWVPKDVRLHHVPLSATGN